MDTQGIAALITLGIGLFFVIVIFLVLRELVLWYFRINQIADNLAYIADHFRRVDQEAGRRVQPATNSGTGSVGSGPAPMSKPVSQP